MIFHRSFRRHLLPLIVLAAHCCLVPITLAGANGLAATVNGSAITRAEVDDQIKNQINEINAQVPDAANRNEFIS